jgi:ribosomal protein S18 acetylase RimI-like enzyme
LGYGKGLLQNVLNFAKKRNFYTIKLNTQETNESALSLYKKHGFIVQKKKLIIMTNA